MIELTKEQLNFINKHNIGISECFNAKGLKKSEYRPIMKEFNLVIAYNVTPCKKFDHSLRNRSGKCVQCNTASLAFQNRFSQSGVLYIAGSKNKETIKIGVSKSKEIRLESLNRIKYGGTNDWHSALHN